MLMCGIGTGKSQSPGNPHRDSSSFLCSSFLFFLSSFLSFLSSAPTLLGMLEPSSTALPATAARPKKPRRDTAAMNLEAGEVLSILVLLVTYCLVLCRFEGR